MTQILRRSLKIVDPSTVDDSLHSPEVMRVVTTLASSSQLMRALPPWITGDINAFASTTLPDLFFAFAPSTHFTQRFSFRAGQARGPLEDACFSLLPKLDNLQTLELQGRARIDTILSKLVVSSPTISSSLSSATAVDAHQQLSSLPALRFLKSLDITCSEDVTDAGIELLINLPSLQRLSIPYCTNLTGRSMRAIANMIKTRKMLRNLDISGFPFEHTESDSAPPGLERDFINLLDQEDAKRLRELDISFCLGLSTADIKSLKKLSHLEVLNVAGNDDSVRNSSLVEALSSMNFLRELNASFCDISDFGLSALPESCQRLQKLKLEETSLNKEGFKYIGDLCCACGNLEEIIIPHAGNGPPPTAAAVAGATAAGAGPIPATVEEIRLLAQPGSRLRTLRLGQMHNVKPDDWACLKELKHHLKSLDIFYCNISDAALSQLLPELTQLEELSLGRNCSYSDECLAAHVGSLKMLETLEAVCGPLTLAALSRSKLQYVRSLSIIFEHDNTLASVPPRYVFTLNDFKLLRCLPALRMLQTQMLPLRGAEGNLLSREELLSAVCDGTGKDKECFVLYCISYNEDGEEEEEDD